MLLQSQSIDFHAPNLLLESASPSNGHRGRPTGGPVLPAQARFLDDINRGVGIKQPQLHNRLGVEPIELSPYHHVSEQTPPTIVFHGTRDRTVPFVSAALFVQELKAEDVEFELKTYNGSGHGFFNGEPFLSQTMQELDDFLVGLGWLN